jgi:hypothetical protein
MFRSGRILSGSTGSDRWKLDANGFYGFRPWAFDDHMDLTLGTINDRIGAMLSLFRSNGEAHECFTPFY